jgi:hypothetical protein
MKIWSRKEQNIIISGTKLQKTEKSHFRAEFQIENKVSLSQNVFNVLSNDVVRDEKASVPVNNHIMRVKNE